LLHLKLQSSQVNSSGLFGAFCVTICYFIYTQKKTPKFFSIKLFFLRKKFRNIFIIIFLALLALSSQPTFQVFFFQEKVKSILDFENWTKINVQKCKSQNTFGKSKFLEFAFFSHLAKNKNIFLSFIYNAKKNA